MNNPGPSSPLLLRIIDGTVSRGFVLQSSTVLLGAAPGNDILCAGADIPDVVAQVEPLVHPGCGWALQVLAAGEVKINGKKVKQSTLCPGDRIEIGNTLVLVDIAQPGESHHPTPAPAWIDALASFARMVGGERDVTRLLRSIIDILFKTVDATDAFVFNIDQTGKPVVFVSSHAGDTIDRFSDTVVQAVLKKRSTLFLPNVLSDPLFKNSVSVCDLSLHSVICCPMLVAGRICGVIYLGSNRASVSFEPHQIEAVETCATLSGMLIDHVDYIGQQRTIIRNLSSSRHPGIIAESKAMQEVLSQVDDIASSSITVLLLGETGCGKDVFAQLICQQSPRAAGKFVAVNCSSLRKELMESELFGHRRGSFTGAQSDRTGLFFEAHGGTLFLDEIGELDLSVQAGLLRAIETGMIRPVGAATEEAVDIRLICATNRDLRKMCEEGQFREDLYYRLCQFAISVPPLRERGNDSLLLAYFYLEKYRSRYPEKECIDFHPESLHLITSYSWPGNIRELASMVHRAVLSSKGALIRLEPSWIKSETFDLTQATHLFQKKLIKRVLESTGGNKDQAAKILGVHRSTLFRMISDE